MPTEKQKITIYLGENIKRDISKLADLNDRSVSNFVLLLIKKAIENAKQQGLLESDLVKPKK